MTYLKYAATRLISPTAILMFAGLFSIPQGTFAQNRDYAHHDYDQGRRLPTGTAISVKAGEAIDSRGGDRQSFRGFVTNGVRDDNGRIVIPDGSPVEIRVRVMPDNDLRLALRSVNVRGQQYNVETDPMHVEARQEGGVIGGIIGALSNGEVGGREVHIPRDATLTFRLESPLVTGRPHYDRDRDRDRPER